MSSPTSRTPYFDLHVGSPTSAHGRDDIAAAAVAAVAAGSMNSSIMSKDDFLMQSTKAASISSGDRLSMGLSPISHTKSVALQQREIVRIHELWQKAKADLRHKSAELAELKTRVQIAESTSRRVTAQMDDHSRLQLENSQLRDRVRVAETDLEE